ncbi:hypothetical protein [Ramlibacter pallidus]|uniref:Tetratricopeptide repeat protein n=1 Tax=Ramlibacter pallidus TaxID=2780087 RepID=A0ABR9RZI2_9BURK|nr:hypothetical protein [Ramlibacter pallidus]MBE7366672.1 hypothetical protein [Ramlibacter pallidus]
MDQTAASPATAPAAFNRLLAEGLAASQAGRREAALDLFARAGAADPSSGVPHFLIASEHAGAGDLPAAEQAYAQAVLLAPQFSLARYQLGLLQFSTQRVPSALRTWEPLLALPDDDALPHFVRGFAALAQDALDDALRHFRAGLSLGTDSATLRGDVLQMVAAVERLQEPGREGAR